MARALAHRQMWTSGSATAPTRAASGRTGRGRDHEDRWPVPTRAEDSLPPLAEEPRDLRGGRSEAENADEVVYRLGLHALPVPGLPDYLSVDDIEVSFVRGPIRAQRTAMRQRHELPVVFDKRMARENVGDGEVLAVFLLHEAPVLPITAST